MRTVERNRSDDGSLAPAEVVPRWRIVRRWLLIALGGLVLLAWLGYLAVGAYVATQLTKPERKAQRASPADYGLAFEETAVTARDGLSLAGWFIPASGSDRAIVLVHGRGSCRSCEFDGRFVEFAARLHDQGFNVLMIDLRAHGGSEGRNFTLGVQERWDVLGAADWLRGRGFEKIGVLGVSLGAASAAKAAADPEGRQALRAVVLDSSFGDVREILEDKFVEESGLPTTFIPGSILMARLLLGVDISDARPVGDLPKIEAPLMLIFGGQDDTVPVAQFRAMAAARPDATAWFVADAGHARVYNAYPDEYVARVSRFFAEALR